MRAPRKIGRRMPPRPSPKLRIPCVEVDRMVRAAWEKAGRVPAWPPPTADSRGFSAAIIKRLRPYAGLLGWVDDYALARRTGISRATLIIIRRTCGIPGAPRPAALTWTPEQAYTWVESLRSGAPVSRLAKRAGVHEGLVRAFARTIGWHRSWSIRGPNKDVVGRLRRSEVLRRYRRGE